MVEAKYNVPTLKKHDQNPNQLILALHSYHDISRHFKSIIQVYYKNWTMFTYVYAGIKCKIYPHY